MERHEFSAVPHSAGAHRERCCVSVPEGLGVFCPYVGSFVNPRPEFAGYNYADYIPAVEMER
jgi:hypothetical protein